MVITLVCNTHAQPIRVLGSVLRLVGLGFKKPLILKMPKVLEGLVLVFGLVKLHPFNSFIYNTT